MNEPKVYTIYKRVGKDASGEDIYVKTGEHVTASAPEEAVFTQEDNATVRISLPAYVNTVVITSHAGDEIWNGTTEELEYCNGEDDEIEFNEHIETIAHPPFNRWLANYAEDHEEEQVRMKKYWDDQILKQERLKTPSHKVLFADSATISLNGKKLEGAKLTSFTTIRQGQSDISDALRYARSMLNLPVMQGKTESLKHLAAQAIEDFKLKAPFPEIQLDYKALRPYSLYEQDKLISSYWPVLYDLHDETHVINAEDQQRVNAMMAAPPPGYYDIEEIYGEKGEVCAGEKALGTTGKDSIPNDIKSPEPLYKDETCRCTQLLKGHEDGCYLRKD